MARRRDIDQGRRASWIHGGAATRRTLRRRASRVAAHRCLRTDGRRVCHRVGDPRPSTRVSSQ